jgi:cobalt-zinc-cadmium efflux system outer membrane protein
MQLYRLSAAALLATALTGAVRAAPLTYAGALAVAQASAPSLEARTLQAQGARAAAQAAGQLPDPKLGVAVEGFPVSGPNAGHPSRDDFSDVRLGLSQEMPSRAKRKAQRDRAATDVLAADTAQRLGGRDVRLGTALAWINLYYAKQRLAALDGLLASLDPLWRTAPASVKSGGARPAQALEADLMRADLADRRAELQAGAGRARAELARWTADPDADVAGPPPAFTVDEAALRRSIEQNPDLAVRDAEVRKALADVALARAETRPDWGWEVGYQRRDPRFGDMVSAGVTVSLPIFAASRQDPMIAARVAAAGQARAEREAARRELLAQLDAGLADHTMHHEQWMRAQTLLTPLAKQRADLETASYAAGRAGLPDVLQALTALANAQLTLLDREAAVATDGARLVLTFEGADR